MGRTKRIRNRTKVFKTNNLSYEQLLNLQSWLSKNHWKNDSKLKIKTFLKTGRGITSNKTILPHDILISMPIQLMITYRSIKINFPIKEKLTMQELLAFYLAVEKMKGKDSKWYEYLISLPEEIPDLPWLATSEELIAFPTDLRLATEKPAANLKIFLDKANKLIKDTDWILNDCLFRWAFIMVNTRAVYIDSKLISDEFSSDLLLDEPSMALCPFLDMFNHHFLANTEVNLVKNSDELIYQLKSLTGFKKNKQIFISYGQHDNIKLLMEYGFFIPGNIFDTIKFEFEDILFFLNFNLDQNRYKFIKEHDFHTNLYIGYEGVSYNLKILLFVGCSEDFRHLDSIVFSDNYPKYFLEKSLPQYVKSLLKFKTEIFKKELIIIKNSRILGDNSKNIVEFVEYRTQFIDELKKLYLRKSY